MSPMLFNMYSELFSIFDQALGKLQEGILVKCVRLDRLTTQLFLQIWPGSKYEKNKVHSSQ